MSDVTEEKLSLQQIQWRAAEYVNHANALLAQGRYDDSLTLFNNALELKPDMALAYFNRGVLFFHLQDKAAMAEDFGQAMRLEPGNVDMLYNVAVFLQRAELHMQSVGVMQRIVEIDPQNPAAWLALAYGFYEMGNTDSVEKLLEHISKKFPNDHAVREADALFVPPTARSREDIDRTRARFVKKVQQLIADGVKASDPLSGRHKSLFFLPYQGRPHKEISQLIARFFLQSFPELSYAAPHCSRPRRKAGEKIRIGFVSPSMHKTTLNQFLLRGIEHLNAHPGFEVYIFSSAPSNDSVVLGIKQRIARYIDLPFDVKLSQQAIAREEMDVLLYMEVGSDPLMYALPFARLAHLQCVWGGIPVTTGIPNMDIFISASECDEENADAHYSEKLLLLSRALVVFTRFARPDRLKTRAELGLPDGDVRLYACPVTLHKLHPDMDFAFRAILEKDPKARILLFDPKTNLTQNVLMRRFASVMPPELLQRVLFLPHVPGKDFISMLCAVDCVLDTFHLSFGTTAYISVAANVPFVTWPGPYMCGRTAYWMFRRMGMPELIAETHDAYADIAVRLANDKAFYTSMQEKMTAGSAQFFDDYAIIDEFAQRIQQLYFEDR